MRFLKQERKFQQLSVGWITRRIPGQKLVLQQNSFRTKAVIKEVVSKMDIHSFASLESDDDMKLNDICKVLIKTADIISFDS